MIICQIGLHPYIVTTYRTMDTRGPYILNHKQFTDEKVMTNLM